jgi:hypothetical protein
MTGVFSLVGGLFGIESGLYPPGAFLFALTFVTLRGWIGHY